MINKKLVDADTLQEQEQQAGAERFSCSCLLLLLLPRVSDIQPCFSAAFCYIY